MFVVLPGRVLHPTLHVPFPYLSVLIFPSMVLTEPNHIVLGTYLPYHDYVDT